MKKLYAVHPLLFSIIAPLVFFVENMRSVYFTDVVRSLIVSFITSLIILFVLWKLLRNLNKAALISTLLIFLVYSYYHLTRFIPKFNIVVTEEFTVGKHKIIFPIVMFLLGFIIYRIIKAKRNFRFLSKYLTFSFAIIIVLNLFKIADFHIRKIRLPHSDGTYRILVTGESITKPDVYYIILDGYARNDVLQKKFDLDNSQFTNFLLNNEFYVATASSSNYAQTFLSIGSSLNTNYLENLNIEYSANENDRTILRKLIVNSSVVNTFKEDDYTFITFSSGYEATDELPGADIYYSQWFGMNHFEQRLLNISLIRRIGIFLNLDLSKISRERYKYNLEKIIEIPERSEPTFTFIHVLHPHPPFLFGPNGEVLNKGKPYALRDGDGFDGTKDEYKSGYKDQLLYVNKTMQSVITNIINRSDIPPIIILQSDHGSGLDVYWKDPYKTDVWERMSNFIAIYAPDKIKNKLYPTLSPVNIFRIIVSQLFEEKLDLLEDKSYFSTLDLPYKMYEVRNGKIIQQ